MKENSSSRPLVAVTGPTKRLKFGWWAARVQLWRAGLKGIYITADQPNLPDDINGVIIGGGDDIDPQHYGATGTAGVNYDPARDALEVDVINRAIDKGLPILGICRGSQLINVVHGGSLFTDIRPLRKLTPNRNSLFPIKSATVEPDSRLGAIFGATEIAINSLHSQAIDRLGDGLAAVAHDRDGFIQAIENPNYPFLIGVQWHPEYLLHKPDQKKLFLAFAKHVSEFSKAT